MQIFHLIRGRLKISGPVAGSTPLIVQSTRSRRIQVRGEEQLDTMIQATNLRKRYRSHRRFFHQRRLLLCPLNLNRDQEIITTLWCKRPCGIITKARLKLRSSIWGARLKSDRFRRALKPTTESSSYCYRLIHPETVKILRNLYPLLITPASLRTPKEVCCEWSNKCPVKTIKTKIYLKWLELND